MTTKKSLFFLMGALALADLTSAFETSMLYSALPTIVRETKDIVGSGLLISVYLLVQAASACIGGRLGDMYGRRRVLIIALLCCTVGSLISASASSLPGIIVGRAVQGLSGAILPLCFGIIREQAGRDRGPLLIGIMAGVYTAGAVVGYAAGGAVVQWMGWRGIFDITSALPLVGMVATILTVPATPGIPPKGRLDLMGGVLFVPSVVAILTGISLGPSWGWAAPSVLALLGGGAALLTFWAIYEWRHPEPLINTRLFLNRQILLTNGIYCLLGLGPLQSAIVLMLLLQQPPETGIGLGLSAFAAGMLKLPTSLASAMSAPMSGWMSARWGGRISVLYGTGLMAVAWLYLIMFHNSILSVVVGMTINLFATGMLYAAVPNVIVEVAPSARTSEATGLASLVRAISMSIGAQLVAALLALHTVRDHANGSSPAPAATAYMTCFVFFFVMSLLQFALASLMPKRSAVTPEVHSTRHVHGS